MERIESKKIRIVHGHGEGILKEVTQEYLKHDKRVLEYKLNNLTKDINKINSKIQTCKRIITKAEKGEKEAILIKNRVAENQLNNELEGLKNKDKKRTWF